MIRRNRYDKRGCLEMDDVATTSFINLANSKGWSCFPAKNKDYNDHWDWKIVQQNASYNVDLKSLKRINSKDDYKTDDLILIELKAVNTLYNFNRNGWLYGKADFICFEMKDSFVFISRQELQDYIENTIDTKSEPTVSNQNKVRHIIYTRKGRGDKFVYVYKSELIRLVKAVWRKNGI